MEKDNAEKIHILGTEHWLSLSSLASIININKNYHSFPIYNVPRTTKHFNYIISFNHYKFHCDEDNIFLILQTKS